MARTPINKLLYINDIEQKEVREALGKSQTYITQRVMGRMPFTIDDAYIICDLAGVPHEDIPKYFPMSKKGL